MPSLLSIFPLLAVLQFAWAAETVTIPERFLDNLTIAAMTERKPAVFAASPDLIELFNLDPAQQADVASRLLDFHTAAVQIIAKHMKRDKAANGAEQFTFQPFATQLENAYDRAFAVKGDAGAAGVQLLARLSRAGLRREVLARHGAMIVDGSGSITISKTAEGYRFARDIRSSDEGHSAGTTVSREYPKEYQFIRDAFAGK